MTCDIYGTSGPPPTKMRVSSFKLIEACNKLAGLCKNPPHHAEYNMAAVLIATLPQLPGLLRTIINEMGEPILGTTRMITSVSPELARRVNVVKTFNIRIYSADDATAETSLEALYDSSTVLWIKAWVARHRALQPIDPADLWWMVLADSSQAGWYQATRQCLGYFEHWIAAHPPREQRHTPVSITAALPRLRRLS